MFFKHSQGRKLTILLVYIDVITIPCDDLIERQLLKEKLSVKFKSKDLRKFKYFLKIEVAYLKQGILISQKKYVLDLLHKI